MTHRGQRRDGGDLAGAQIKPGAAVDVAERKLDQIAREIRRDVGKRIDDLFAGLAVNG
jgi:hypothetical protein